MVKVETLRDDGFKRVLRCREGNRIWYQMWITDTDMWVVNGFFYIPFEKGEIKYWWLPNLQQYYVFFYEKRLGKGNTHYLLNSIL